MTESKSAVRPLVSICIPTYNYAHYLGEAVASALDQSYERIELIVSDDASSDDTHAVMERFASDPRVRFMPLDENIGMFANFNRCWEHARGSHIKYLLADDWLSTNCVERLMFELETHPDASIASCNNWMIDEAGAIFGEQVNEFGETGLIAPKEAAAVMARGFNAIGMPTNTLIARERIAQVGGFDARYQPSADMQLWLKLLSVGGLAWSAEPLCFLRFHDAHTHRWAGRPDVSSLEVWRDAPDLPDSPVDQDLARIAQRNWSRLFTTHAAGFALKRDWATARRLLSDVRRHVGLMDGAAMLAKSLPQSLRSRSAIREAKRAGRTVRHAPFPEVGRRPEDLHAAAATGVGPRLRSEIARS